MRKFLSITLVAVLLVSCFTFAVNAADKKVSVRIEGKEETYYCGDVALGESKTVLDVVKAIDEADENLTVDIVESQYGAYISGINEDKEATENVMEGEDIIATYYIGWMFAVNNQNASVGVSAYELQGGEDIVLYYADMSAQVPVADFSEKGKITLTSYDYLPDWSGMEWQPVTGVNVTLNGKEYISNIEGVVTYDPDDFKNLVNVQVYSTDEVGYPLVCRFPENYGFDMNSFKDEEPAASEAAPAAAKPVTLNYKQSLIVKGTYQIDITSDEAVKYSSSNAKVASVSTKGKITARKAGSAVVTAKAGNVTAKYKITVKALKLSATSKTIKKGKSFTLKVTGATGKVKFSSSKTSVVKVNANGKVTGKKTGKAVIKVVANGVTLNCKVTVK